MPSRETRVQPRHPAESPPGCGVSPARFFGEALIPGETGPCPGMSQRCPIKNDEAYAFEKCWLDDCHRRLAARLRAAESRQG